MGAIDHRRNAQRRHDGAGSHPHVLHTSSLNNKGARSGASSLLERDMRFELTTFSLATRHSTTELIRSMVSAALL